MSRRWDEEELTSLISMYKRGWKVETIADKLERSEKAIRCQLSLTKVTRKTPSYETHGYCNKHGWIPDEKISKNYRCPHCGRKIRKNGRASHSRRCNNG